MNVLGLSGLYSPWTAEALVHPSLSPASLPFTACHELMHRLGIADEGQANIAAWEACRQAGGQASASADLWALKYAMNALRAYSEEIWRDCTTEMDGALVRAFSDMNGFATPSPQRSPLRARIISALGLDSVTGNYDALIGWLAIDIPPTG